MTHSTDDSRVFVIAEAGVNHNGSLDSAKKLVEVAAEAGADAVKFQTFKAEQLVTKQAATAVYQAKNTDASSQYEMLQHLELSVESHEELARHARACDIEFLSTGFDVPSVEFLNALPISTFKIPSGDITNFPLIRAIAGFGKPVIVSTGMATMEEIADCLKLLDRLGIRYEQTTVLHCNTQYPTPMRDVNLNAMISIKNEFPGISIGYSDHTLGIEVPIAAVAMGAKVIEKHFTLNQSQPGPDHSASLNPAQLTAMVSGIRNVELALGDGNKIPTESEKPNITVARRSIVASTFIAKGDFFSESNLAAKRPAGGLSPMLWPTLLGTKAHRNYEPDEQID